MSLSNLGDFVSMMFSSVSKYLRHRPVVGIWTFWELSSMWFVFIVRVVTDPCLFRKEFLANLGLLLSICVDETIEMMCRVFTYQRRPLFLP